MLGPSKARDLDRPIVVSLDQLVPADHFYRHLEGELDLSFVRDWVRERYAPNGRPSIDPVVFFKLELALFFEGLRSERQPMRVAVPCACHRCPRRRKRDPLWECDCGEIPRAEEYGATASASELIKCYVSSS